MATVLSSGGRCSRSMASQSEPGWIVYGPRCACIKIKQGRLSESRLCDHVQGWGGGRVIHPDCCCFREYNICKQQLCLGFTQKMLELRAQANTKGRDGFRCVREDLCLECWISQTRTLAELNFDQTLMASSACCAASLAGSPGRSSPAPGTRASRCT